MSQRYFLVYWIFLTINYQLLAQGLPPGWNYNPTPTTHIISIPLSSNPNINGYLLKPGDWIGVFYMNSSGEYSCGGAVEWNGTQNTGIIAFGDDVFTPQKDGFAHNEPIVYRVYSWSVQAVYNATVTCNNALPNSCLNFVSNGLSGISSLNASGLYLVLSASATTVCEGNSVQLMAQASGGAGGYIFQWSSTPTGFSSNLQNPVVNPTVTTTFHCQVTSQGNTVNTSITIEVIPPPIAMPGNNSTICANQNFQLNGSAFNALSYWWSTSGDGYFSNSTILNPIYYPGNNDIQNGGVQICLNASSIPECPLASSCLTLSIQPLPNVSLTSFPSYCTGDPPFNLYGGSPPGGLYFVNGVQTSVFNPAISGVYQVVYQYTNPNGCTNSASTQIIVHPLPTVNCPANIVVCCTSNAIPLTGGTPGGGTYSGQGVINNIFYPDCNNTGTFNITYTYQSPATGCSNTCQFTITVKPLPAVSCPNDFQVCINTPPFPLSGGLPPDGTYHGPGVFNNIFNPAVAGPGQHQIFYTYTDQTGCSNTCTFYISVNILPQANAGPPQLNIQLPNTVVYLGDATAANYSSISWTTSGSGYFNNPSLLNPIYYLSGGDIQYGSVILTLTAINSCGSTSDQILVIISNCQLANVNAGNNGTICEGQTFYISDASASNYSFLQWSNPGGDGNFNNPYIINPTYYPGPQDILSGCVVLTLTAFPIEPCDTVSDSKLLFITRLPNINAGTDRTICQNETVNLNAEASNFSYLLWTTSGDGTFTNPFNPQTVYIPGNNDIMQGVVFLKLTGYPLFPCQSSTFDQITTTIVKLPLVDAGPDMTITAGQSAHLNGYAANYFEILWTTSGDGVFNAASVLNPVYYPGLLDNQNGFVLLTLTAYPLSPCNNIISDDLLLIIDTQTNIQNILGIKANYIVFPIPSREFLCIKSLNFCYPVRKIIIRDLKGTTVFQQEYMGKEEETLCFNVGHIQQGLYILYIQGDGISIYRKIIIQNDF